MKKLLFLLAFIPTLLFGQTPPIYNVLGAGNNANGRSLIGLSLIGLRGASSGTITVQGPAVVTTYTFTLPANDGTSGQFLQTDGNGVTSWQTISTGLTVGTTPIASGAAKNILYEGAGNVLQETSTFVYDYTNARVGINTGSPQASLHVQGAGTTTATASFQVDNLIGTNRFKIYNSGHVRAGDENNNVFIGELSGLNSAGSGIQGKSNTGLGFYTLKANTTGYYNVAIGDSSLLKNTSGLSNTGVGAGTIRENTTGNDLTACGNDALEHNTTGSHNTALGVDVLYQNTTGQYNVGAGNDALKNGNSSFNSAFGYQALVGVNAVANCAFGYQSQASNSTGEYNTSMGYQSGYFNITGLGNTCIGAYAGAYETGSKMMYLDAGIDRTNLAGGQANSLIVGYGHSSGVGSQSLVLNGKVGVGVTPTFSLDVLGTIHSTQAYTNDQISNGTDMMTFRTSAAATKWSMGLLNESLYFYDKTALSVTFDQGGKIAAGASTIGTCQLRVKGSVDIQSSKTDAAYAGNEDNVGDLYFCDAQWHVRTGTANDLRWYSYNAGSVILAMDQKAGGAIKFTQGAKSALTASTEYPFMHFDADNASIQLSTGALATQRTNVFDPQAIDFVGASTITNYATVAISAAATAGTNSTITNNYAFWVQAGTSRFDASVGIGTKAVASAALQVASTSQGFLMPVMTGAQGEAIASPATGLLIYTTNAGSGDITSAGWWGYNGANWVKLN